MTHSFPTRRSSDLDVAAKLRLFRSFLRQKGLETRLIETARHAGKDRKVGDAAVDEPLAHAKAHIFGQLLEGRALDELVEHLIEPARFDKGRHRQSGLLFARLVIRHPHPVAQFAKADVGVADARDIRAAAAAEPRLTGPIPHREAEAADPAHATPEE